MYNMRKSIIKNFLQLLSAIIEKSTSSLRKKISSQNTRIQQLEERNNTNTNVPNVHQQRIAKKLKKRVKRSENQIIELKHQISTYHISSYGVERVNDEVFE